MKGRGHEDAQDTRTIRNRRRVVVDHGDCDVGKQLADEALEGLASLPTTARCQIELEVQVALRQRRRTIRRGGRPW